MTQQKLELTVKEKNRDGGGVTSCAWASEYQKAKARKIEKELYEYHYLPHIKI